MSTVDLCIGDDCLVTMDSSNEIPRIDMELKTSTAQLWEFTPELNALNATEQMMNISWNETSYIDNESITNIISTTLPPMSSEDKYVMSSCVFISWTSIFSFMIFVAIGGNLIVMWIVIAHRRMRSVTNYFLVNLSSADLLMSTLNCLFNFIYMLDNHWPFGDWYCTVNNFVATVSVSASVLTLTAITCDRYMAIVRPLQPRMSKRMALVAIAIVWISSGLIGGPCLLYSSTFKIGNSKRIVCILIWPDGPSNISQMDFTYQVALMVLTYFIPIILMICCYVGMGRVLWGSKSIGEMSQRQADSIRSKRKVVKMFIFVMVVFIVCWLPYHGYFIYTHCDRSILSTHWVQHLYLGFYWLAMSNAMVNPLIYYWMNARFRKYFITAVCGWKKYLIRKAMRFHGQPGNETPVLGRNTHSFSRSASDEVYSERLQSLSRWFSRKSRNRQTSTSIVRESTKRRSISSSAIQGNQMSVRHNCQPNFQRKGYLTTPEKNGNIETAYV